MPWFFRMVIWFWTTVFWLFGMWLLFVQRLMFGGSKSPSSDGQAIPDAQAKHSNLIAVDEFGANPGALKMWTYRGKTCVPGAPLIVVLHGSTQTAAEYANGAGWIELADEHGLFILCPEQTKANNGTLSFNWFRREDTNRDSGEPASIKQMIDIVTTGERLDPNRVFVTGLSSGGAMTAVMLATYPEVFAGGAVVAGLPYGAATTVPGALWVMFAGRRLAASDWGDKVRAAHMCIGPRPPVSIWHGDKDKVVNPKLADALALQWTDVHAVDATDASVSTSAGRRTTEWKTPEGTPLVTLHIMSGMGHGAPVKTSGANAYGAPGPYLLEEDVSSSYEIARAWQLIVPNPALAA